MVKRYKEPYFHGDKIICISKRDTKQYRFVEIGKEYTVDISITTDAFSIVDIDILMGAFHRDCFQTISEYKYTSNKRRLKKVKYLQKPKWQRKLIRLWER